MCVVFVYDLQAETVKRSSDNSSAGVLLLYYYLCCSYCWFCSYCLVLCSFNCCERRSPAHFILLGSSIQKTGLYFGQT